MKAWIQGNPNITIKELRLQIQSELGKEVSKSTAHNLIKELGFAYITPRPRHHKQDKLAQSEFKKNLPKILESNPEYELFF